MPQILGQSAAKVVHFFKYAKKNGTFLLKNTTFLRFFGKI